MNQSQNLFIPEWLKNPDAEISAKGWPAVIIMVWLIALPIYVAVTLIFR